MQDGKRCFKCGETKPRDEFYAHPQMADGLLGKCKPCARKDTTGNRRANIDRYRAYDRDRALLPHRKLLAQRIQAKWRLDFPERREAHVVLGNAVRAGLVRPHPCWVCGKRAEAHHPDYGQPLDVVWLCPAHHKQTHAMQRSLTKGL